jgi:hypothetical protein
MRHLKSFLLSLVLAPTIWALTGVGLAVHRSSGAGLETSVDTARVVGLAALAGAGVLVAVLALGRLSPLGPALAGLGFLAAAGYAPALPGLLPELPMGLDAALLRPAEGYAVLIGVPLVATALCAHRWQRTAAAPAPAPAPAPDHAAPERPPAANSGLPAADPTPTPPLRSWADDVTDDLSAALLPLRTTPPAA